MSDTYRTLVVTLRQPMHEEDADRVMDSIRMLGPVASVALGTADDSELQWNRRAAADDVARSLAEAATIFRLGDERWERIRRILRERD